MKFFNHVFVLRERGPGVLGFFWKLRGSLAQEGLKVIRCLKKNFKQKEKNFFQKIRKFGREVQVTLKNPLNFTSYVTFYTKLYGYRF